MSVAKDKKPNRKIASKSLEVLTEWTAPERIWYPKSQQWFLGSAAVILFFIFIAVRIEWYIGIIALLAFMVMWFAQGYLEPLEVKHKITSKGVFTRDRLFSWSEITYFWFAEKEETLLLHLDFPKDANLPRLTLLVPYDLEFEIFDTLIDNLSYGDPSQVEYMFFSRYIYGEYLPVSRYIIDLDRETE